MSLNELNEQEQESLQQSPTAPIHTLTSATPAGLTVEHSVVSDDAWEILKHWIDTGEWLEDEGYNNSQPQKISIPWEIGGQNRRVAQFGFRYNYETSCVGFGNDDGSSIIPLIPAQLRSLFQLDRFCGTQHDFTQCIINVYDPETIIPWHMDHEAFGPTVVVFTFGEDRPLYLRRQREQPIAGEKSDDAPTTLESTFFTPTPNRLWNEFRSLEWKESPDILDPHLYDYYIGYPTHGSRYILSGAARHSWEHAVPTGSGWRISVTFRSPNPAFLDAEKQQQAAY